jgi:hypothetical protein
LGLKNKIQGAEMCENMDALRRLVLEAENILELIETDEDCNLRWVVEKETMEETLAEARRVLWPKEE